MCESRAVVVVVVVAIDGGFGQKHFLRGASREVQKQEGKGKERVSSCVVGNCDINNEKWGR